MTRERQALSPLALRQAVSRTCRPAPYGTKLVKHCRLGAALRSAHYRATGVDKPGAVLFDRPLRFRRRRKAWSGGSAWPVPQQLRDTGLRQRFRAIPRKAERPTSSKAVQQHDSVVFGRMHRFPFCNPVRGVLLRLKVLPLFRRAGRSRRRGTGPAGLSGGDPVTQRLAEGAGELKPCPVKPAAMRSICLRWRSMTVFIRRRIVDANRAAQTFAGGLRQRSSRNRRNLFPVRRRRCGRTGRIDGRPAVVTPLTPLPSSWGSRCIPQENRRKSGKAAESYSRSSPISRPFSARA